MKMPVCAIKVKERIRKNTIAIDELAADISKNGLINALTVMEDGEGLTLLAGLRRLRAVQSIGWEEVEVNVMSPEDAEAELRIEFSENDQRRDFTSEEKLDYARQLERIEAAKAKERMSLGGKGGLNTEQGKDDRPYLTGKQRREAIGEKLNLSGRQYDRLRYIGDNAPEDVLEKIDSGEKTISGVYEELRAKKRAENAKAAPKTPVPLPKREQPAELAAPALPAKTENSVDTDCAPTLATPSENSEKPAPPEKPARPPKPPITPQMKRLDEQENERLRKLKEYDALPPEAKIAELERRIDEETTRANRAEHELTDFKYKTHNDIYHRDCEIQNLKQRNEELSAALEAANVKIAEFEGR